MYTPRFIILILLCLSIAACDQNSENTETSNTEIEENDSNSKKAGNSIDSKNKQNVISTYLKLKNALVETNTESAAKAAGELAAYSLENDNPHMQKIHVAAVKVGESRDIHQQRESFEDLSGHIYELIKETGSSNTLYKQYCPMAFDNKGAYWLSAEKEIRNPYFGDEMLHCGSVKETID